jgi:hypothetical protein
MSCFDPYDLALAGAFCSGHVSSRGSLMKRFCEGMFVGLLVVFGLVGCDAAGGNNSVKFDATSLATSRESLQKMTAGMSDEQKKQFSKSATAVAFRMNEGTQNSATAEGLWKGVHGMTKSEIEAKAREIEAQENAGKPK